MESIQAEDESAKLCKRRIEHLKEHSSDQPAAASLWKRKRMDRMMVEHLLRCGYYNTAVKLARQSGIEVGRVPGLPAPPLARCDGRGRRRPPLPGLVSLVPGPFPAQGALWSVGGAGRCAKERALVPGQAAQSRARPCRIQCPGSGWCPRPPVTKSATF